MTDAPKLLPCPFCGGCDIVFPIQKSTRGECADCSTWGPEKPTPTEAISAWNRRPDLTDEQVERAAKAMFDVPTPDGDHFGTIIYESDRIDPCDNVQEGIATTMRYLRIAARAALLAAREAGGE